MNISGKLVSIGGHTEGQGGDNWGKAARGDKATDSNALHYLRWNRAHFHLRARK
jgi:hypothetical protein